MHKVNFGHANRILRANKLCACGMFAGLLVMASSGFSPAVGQEALERSSSVKLDPSPGWTISGVWTAGGSTVTLVDARSNALLEYSVSGSLKRPIPSPTSGIQFPLPSIIQRLDNGYLLEDEDGHFVWLNQDLEPYKQANLLQPPMSNGEASVGAIYGWIPVEGNLLAFADIEKKNGDWSSAFLLIPLDFPTNFRILEEIALTDPARAFYHFGNPYLASAGGAGYFLVMSKEPYIVEVRPNGHALSQKRRIPLPVTLRNVPVLPEKKDTASVLEIFHTMEESTMVTGLYGWGNSLFLLRRVVKPERSWELVGLSPLTGKIQSDYTIATTAKHLTVVPGPLRWAFIEKEEVLKLGDQRIPSMFFVDKRALNQR